MGSSKSNGQIWWEKREDWRSMDGTICLAACKLEVEQTVAAAVGEYSIVRIPSVFTIWSAGFLVHG